MSQGEPDVWTLYNDMRDLQRRVKFLESEHRIGTLIWLVALLASIIGFGVWII